MANPKALKIKVGSKEYKLQSNDNDSYLLQLSEELHNDVTNKMKNGLSELSALVLVAMNYLDRCRTISREADQMREQISDYGSEMTKNLIELDRLKREAEKLTKEIKDGKHGS